MERAARRALDAALSVAGELGLPTADPRMLRRGSSLIVHLRPRPVVARVALKTAAVRDGDAWYAREVAVTTFLERAGAPVLAPTDLVAPGPHHRDGLVLTFWPYVEPCPTRVDPEQAGRGLRACHEALEDFTGPLPELLA